MPIEVQTLVDPLAVFMARLHEREQARPIPLVETRFAIAVHSGLAVVSTTRRFRNDEAEPIEAILTFPMPVHAALFALEARIDGRLLHAAAQARAAARETYEHEIQEGKAAVLHEEVLRGIHTLSVANVRPGGEIEVTIRWAAALSFIDGAGQLRIPLTVGDVYGCSGLADADALLANGPRRAPATLSVTPADGTVAVAGVPLVAGRGEVPLDRPIDLRTAPWAAAPLAARAADGRTVTLAIAPAPLGQQPVSLTALFDCSGSMAERFSSRRDGMTNHDVAAVILHAIGAALRPEDRLDLWEFNTGARMVGTMGGGGGGDAAMSALLESLSTPGGGTEIGTAIETAASRSDARDILVLTDGKSYALDVQRLARLGRRVHVVLIGEDSLEANVGHLAALTGGDLFIATDRNLASIAAAMIGSLRLPYLPQPALPGDYDRIETQRGGVRLTARWAAVPMGEMPLPGVAAMAAMLALPALDEERAAALAEAEGLVTHLTSLVLVDEAGAVQEGIPAMRKIPLEASLGPKVYLRGMPVAGAPMAPAAASPRPGHAPGGGLFRPRRAEAAPAAPASAASSPAEPSPAAALRSLATAIDWNVGPARLLTGDLSGLPHEIRAQVDRLADSLRPEAARLGLDARLLVIGIAARIASGTNRTAKRIAAKLLDSLPADLLDAILRPLAVPSRRSFLHFLSLGRG